MATDKQLGVKRPRISLSKRKQRDNANSYRRKSPNKFGHHFKEAIKEVKIHDFSLSLQAHQGARHGENRDAGDEPVTNSHSSEYPVKLKKIDDCPHCKSIYQKLRAKYNVNYSIGSTLDHHENGHEGHISGLWEQTLTEISKRVLGSYIKKARADVDKAPFPKGQRFSGIARAQKKLLTREEQEMKPINELSKKLLGRYVKRARDQIGMKSVNSRPTIDNFKREKGIHRAVDKLTKESKWAVTTDTFGESVQENESLPAFVNQFWNHQKSRGKKPSPVYVLRAAKGHKHPEGHSLGWSNSRKAMERQADLLSNQGPNHIEKLIHKEVKEEQNMKPINELSKKLLGRYVNKAVSNIDDKHRFAQAVPTGNKDVQKQRDQHITKRVKGIKKAVGKLAGLKYPSKWAVTTDTFGENVQENMKGTWKLVYTGSKTGKDSVVHVKADNHADAVWRGKQISPRLTPHTVSLVDQNPESTRQKAIAVHKSLRKEEQEMKLNELSKKLLGRYVKTAAQDLMNKAVNHGSGKTGYSVKGGKKVLTRMMGIRTAADKLTKENFIPPMTDDTLKKLEAATGIPFASLRAKFIEEGSQEAREKRNRRFSQKIKGKKIEESSDAVKALSDQYGNGSAGLHGAVWGTRNSKGHVVTIQGSGYSNGGWHVHVNGELHRFDKPYGEMPPRFRSIHAAHTAAKKAGLIESTITEGQLSFDPFDFVEKHNVDLTTAHSMAKKARNGHLKALKAAGDTGARGWTLRNQLRPYGGLDGSGTTGVRHVYMINHSGHGFGHRMESTEVNEVIHNANHSGQGFDPEHQHHPLHVTIHTHGYTYSHSTPINRTDGSRYIDESLVPKPLYKIKEQFQINEVSEHELLTRPDLEKAREHLKLSVHHSREHSRLSGEALKKYGDHGSLISGVTRDHFPDAIKDTLRHHAHSVSHEIDKAYAARPKGVRMHTMRRLGQTVAKHFGPSGRYGFQGE